MITISDAVNNNIISPALSKMLPSRCLCGHELQFSDDMQKIVCSSDICRTGLLHRLKYINNKLKIGLTSDELVFITKKLKLKSPYQILHLADAYKAKVISSETVMHIKSALNRISEIHNTEYYLHEVISFSGADGLTETISKKLFNGFNTIDEVYRNLDEYRAGFISEKIGSTHNSLASIDLYNTLVSLTDELVYAETIFKIKNTTDSLKIAFMSSNVEPYVNKTEFIEMLESVCDIKFVVVSVIDETTDILIRNNMETGQRYKDARRINEKHIAELVNKGEIKLSDAGKEVAGSLKPVGHLILIGTVEDVIKQLRTVY